MMQTTLDGARRRTRPRGGAFDVAVGARIRERRIALGLTQTDLADALKVTYQQVWKYERGINRVAGQRLFDIAQELDVTVGDLTGSPDDAGLAGDHREIVKLVQAYRKLPQQQRDAVRALVFRLVP